MTKKTETEKPNYLLRHGKMYHNYPIYLNGDIDMSYFLNSFKTINDDVGSLKDLEIGLLTFMRSQYRSLATPDSQNLKIPKKTPQPRRRHHDQQ
jgi:hypothetical protein